MGIRMQFSTGLFWIDSTLLQFPIKESEGPIDVKTNRCKDRKTDKQMVKQTDRQKERVCVFRS